MKKIFLKIIITAALICTIMSLPAAAVGGAVTSPAAATGQGLQDAITAANEGDTIRLNADINIAAAKTEIFVTKSITLDLNGHTISSAFSGSDNAHLKALLTYSAAGTFTVTDSSVPGNGQITSNANYCVLIYNEGPGKVVFERGTLSTTGESGFDIINASNGYISISGGTISSEFGYAVFNTSSNGTLEITGGSVSSNSGYTIVSTGVAEMSGGTVSSDAYYGFLNYGTFTLTNGTISSSKNFALHNFGQLTMEGGTISSDTSDAMSNSGNASIADISGGTIHTDGYKALVNYSSGTVNISGGTISSEGDTAVFNYSNGSVNITGGSISAKRVTFYNNSTGTFTINAGTFASVYNTNGTVKINGGSINTISTKAPVNNAGTGLVLYTFVLKDATGNLMTNTDLTNAALQFTPVSSPAYSMKDVRTDAAGKIYVWLPSNKTAVSLTHSGTTKSGDIVDRSKEIVVPNFTATVTVKKDNALMTEATNEVLLSESNSNIYTGNGAISGTLSNGIYTFKGLDSAKSYYVWLKAVSITCTDIIVTKGAADKTVDLYSISLAKGEGIASTLGDGITIPKGDSFYIRATAAPDYSFSEWVKTLDDSTISTSAEYLVEDISAPLELTAKATINLYPATVTVKKDNVVWTNAVPEMKLSESNTVLTEEVTATFAAGIFSFSGLDPRKTYYVWDAANGIYTGQTINKNMTSAMVDFYTVTLTNGTGVTGVTGAGIYMKGSSVSLNATVVANYAWSKWVESSGGTTISTVQNYTITNISAPYELTATATSTIYDAIVTVRADNALWTIGTADIRLSESSSVADSEHITGTLMNGAYTFIELEYNKTYYVLDITNQQYTGQIINKNSTSVVVDYYTVTLTSGTGIDSTAGAGTYMKGRSVQLNATPSDTYVWSKWIQTSGGATLSTQQAYSITGINKPYALTATGVLDVYTATATVNRNGDVWTGDTPAIWLSDSSTSASNLVNGILSNGVYTFTGLLRAKTYYVWDTTKFTGQVINKNATSAVVDYYTVDLTKDDGISAVTGAGVYMKGTNVSLNATVETGYSWSKWVQTSGSAPFSTSQGYTITNISAPFALTAKSSLNYTGTLNINSGSIVIENSVNSGFIKITQGMNTFDDIDPAASIMIEGAGLTSNKITIHASCGAAITLNNVNMSTETAPFMITEGAGAVTIDLIGTNILTATSHGYAGLQKANGSKGAEGLLTIQSTTGTGSLIATGTGINTAYAAGIGGTYYGGNSQDGSYITITGGTITANGGEYGAGIRGNHITITGGNVTATGGSRGAGIGGAFWGSASYITITGGTVMATGGSQSAGIGGGYAGNADNIIITGGTVTANGSTWGIGGGEVYDANNGNKATNIIVTGGNIKSTFNSTPTNAAGDSVYKTIFTVNGAVNYTDVSGSLAIRDKINSVYGMTDIMTLDTDKVYVYLPQGNASAVYNHVNYATVVSTGNNAVFSRAYTINTPDAITLDGVTATVSFGNILTLLDEGSIAMANVTISGTANRRGTYTFILKSAAFSTSSQTRTVMVGESLSDNLTFTFSMINADISDLTLSMEFVPTPIHTVTYIANDATGGSAPAQMEVYEGDSYTVQGSSTLTRTGYVFANWLNSGTAFVGVKTMGSENVTLNAKWIANNYTVSFNANGGDGMMSDKVLTYDVAQALSQNTFTRTGYTFSGWSITPNGIKVYSDNESVSKLAESGTITLYAMWTANNSTVSFDPNGGAGTMSGQSFTYGSAQAISANTFTKTGYTFSGWAMMPDGVKVYNDNEIISNLAESGSVTFYAMWTANVYTVAFHENGGTGSMVSQNLTYGQSSPLSQNAFTKTGYYFYGWSLTATGEKVCDDEESVSNLAEGGSVTLHALWTESRFTVSFNANGGDGAMTDQIYTYDVPQALSQSAFTKPGYTFSGWAATAEGAKVYNDQQSVSNLAESGTFDLYALWTVNTYKVLFQANGGLGTMPDQTFTYDAAQVLSPKSFTRPNYTFMGWATVLDGAKVYNDSQSVNNLAQSGTVTLFAVWQAKTAVLIDESQKSFTYDGNPKAFSITGTPDNGFTVTYLLNESIVVSPTNSGNYDVSITRAEDMVHAAYNKTISGGLVINKIQASAFTVTTPKDTFTGLDVTTQDLGTLSPSDFTITFGGNPVSATAVSAYDGSKYIVTIPSQTADSTKVLSVIMNDTIQNYFPHASAITVMPTVSVTGISFSQPSVSVARGSSQALTVIFAPTTATNRTMTWVSSDTGVATVSDSGVVSGVETGTATITATTEDGSKVATCTVSVYVSQPGTGAPVPSDSGMAGTGLDTPVTVDGRTENLGKKYTDGTKTTVIVDNASLEKRLDSSAEGSKAIIPIDKNEIATAHLVLKNIEDMAEKNMTLAVQTEGISYNIKTHSIDTPSLRSDFPGVDASDITFEVTIGQADHAAAIVPADTEIVITPVSFSITASHNGKTAMVDSFSNFVDRIMEITEEQSKKITTAVVVEENGTLRHVPTEVYYEGGKWYAKINSMTNSNYALIHNSASFTDTSGKWYAAVVAEMASRKVISGTGENKFTGERAITRAEFAAIIVRALGLPTTGTSAFTDVTKGAWYNGAVGTAFKYGIVSGVGNNRFNPDASITRQDAMVMIERAGKIAGLNSGKASIQGFPDINEVANYALSAVNYNIAEGLIKGSNGKLNLKANITRAETAAVVLRLLQKAGLVDVRATA